MEKLDLHSDIQHEIEDQIAREGGPKHKPVPPLESPTIAKQHTPVYQMHRYFARRPWNVFEHIIQHYTEAGDLILDPFCGGGVTVYEGLRLRRKVIGVDLNPLATWITKMQVAPINLKAFEIAYDLVAEQLQPITDEMYKTTCDKCGKAQAAEWFEWSNVLRCPSCDQKVILAKAKKLRMARYQCTNKNCLAVLIPNECAREDDALINKKIMCDKCGERVIAATMHDIERINRFAADKEKVLAREKLWVPKCQFPDGDLEKDHALFKKGINTFCDLFTPRNLIAIARLRKIILESQAPKNIQEVLWFVFSASLRYVNKMVFRNEGWQAGQPIEWAGHAYWLPNVFIERNISWAFENRINAFLRGKKQSKEELGAFANEFSSTSKGFTYQITTGSSEKTSLPAKYVDCIITDPPFGGNVQYAELCDFWVVWLPEIHKTEGIINNEREAIQTRHSGFPTEKGLEHYEDLLYRIFCECHRVLKDNGYMVMTFHNRDVSVWMALHRAARRAGFDLPSREEVDNHGMVYQDFIQNFKQTFNLRASGSLLGDFILTFKKVRVPATVDSMVYNLSTSQHMKLLERIKASIEYHGGLDNTAIGNLVVEILGDMNLLHRFAGNDLSTLYRYDFSYIRSVNKWYNKEMLANGDKPLNIYDPWPVEKEIENILRDYFNEQGSATEDELLFFIFRKLVNSKRPATDAVSKVLKRCTTKKKKRGQKREVYIWKASQLRSDIEIKDNQIGMFDGHGLNHDDVIRNLANDFIKQGFNVHIGSTEKRKDEGLQALSCELSHLDLGVPQRAFKILKEIDLLILKGGSIAKAIEVVTTFSTFNRAINERFRNLLAVVQNLNFDLEVYLPKNDFEKARKELDTPANIREGLNIKISLREIA